VEVENVTGVSLTSRGTSEKQRHLSVGDGLLGKIVVDDKRVSAIVTEPLADGGTGEGSEVLKRSGLGGGGSNDDGVLHGVVLLKSLDELGDGGSLLADGNVDAVELLLLVAAVVPALLVEDGVETNGSLAGLTVTNDQLTLATADGNHGVDGLETSLDGLVDRLSGQNAGSLELSTASLLGGDGTLAVNGVAESVDDTAEHLRADGDIHNLAGTLDSLTLLDETIGTEKHNTDLAGLEVHAHALDARGELDKLLSLDVGHAVHTGDTITDGKDTASLSETGLLLDTTDSLLEDGRDLSGSSLGVGGVVSGSVDGGGCGISDRGDPASSRDSADGARRLSEGVPEHIKRGTGGLEMKGEQLQLGAIGGRGDWGVRCCLCRRANGVF
jgi:hypothetical protein